MRQRIIIILVIIIAVVLILTLTRGKPERKRVAERKTTSLTAKPKEELAKPVPEVKEEKRKEERKPATTLIPAEKEVSEGWGEDPFVRDFSFLTEIKDLRLTAITISESKSYALINNMIVSVGDEIAGKRIVAIDKDKVVVEKGGRKFEVYLGQ
ncbi:MAG: hypothetical protein ABIK99_04735 [candidate division WOR-3 bacterium]